MQDAARVLGYDFQTGLRISKAMPPLVMGRDTPLYACLEKHDKYEDGYKMAAELRQMYDAEPEVKRVVDVAKHFAAGEFALTRIDYTENAAAGLAAYASVRFVLEARPDPELAFAAGSRMETTRRVARIETWLGEERVREAAKNAVRTFLRAYGKRATV